jgi:hypothetical protein
MIIKGVDLNQGWPLQFYCLITFIIIQNLKVLLLKK